MKTAIAMASPGRTENSPDHSRTSCVPSAPAKPLVPVAYSSMRCSPPAQNVTIR